MSEFQPKTKVRRTSWKAFDYDPHTGHVNELHPIDSAPKDGTEFLAIKPSGHGVELVLVRWSGDAFVSDDGERYDNLTQWYAAATIANY